MDTFFTSGSPFSHLLAGIFITAFLETFAFIGILLPGVAMLFFLAGLSAQQAIPFEYIALAAFSGAFLGDSCSFLLGRHYSQPLRQSRWLRQHPQWLAKGEQFFQRYGILSLIAGRFIGPLRPVLPFTAGALQMSPPRYLSLNAFSACLWAPVYLLPGYLASLGSDALNLNTGLLFEALIVIAVTAWLFSISHHRLTNVNQPPTLATWVLAGVSLAMLSLLFTLQVLGSIQDVNHTLYDQIHATNSNSLYFQFARQITHLGDTLYVLTISGLCALWLYRQKQLWPALSLVLVMIASKLINTLFKFAFAAPRPDPGAHLSSFSFPSGHSSAASTLLCMLAVLLAWNLSASKRQAIYLSATLLAVLVALSRIILGVHWPLDVLTGVIEGFLFAACFKLLLHKQAPALVINSHKKCQLLAGLALLSTVYLLTAAIWPF